MHCQSCAQLIETKVSSLEGIKEIKVNLLEEEATIKFNGEKISLEKIKSEINKLGYSVNEEEWPQKKSIWSGLTYGLIPHIGCIGFIIGSVLGVTMLMNFFKPFLMNRYFFHILIGVSLGLATLSSAFYLNRNDLLSWSGIQKKWKYLSVMYGSTIGINLLLFMLIFPLLANVSASSLSITGSSITTVSDGNTDSLLKLKVDLPCPGHAPLISQELKMVKGVTGVKFNFPNYFEITYHSAETSRKEMLALDIFKSYPATMISESVAEQNIPPEKDAPTKASRSCCGGGGTCGSAGSGGRRSY